MAHKIGQRTAWNVMHMEEQTPCYTLPLSALTTDVEDDNYSIYPNPTNGSFSINLGDVSSM
jgi:hypothetical protein